MARVTGKVIGGNSRDLAARTVGDVKAALGVPNYQANLNGAPAADGDLLKDDDFVTLSAAVKGGRGYLPHEGGN